ncbi:MAG: hypothetical protein JWR01_1383 [Subtercola sp.]|nr:hypothetical protein [Subtercola sp.]
MDATTVVIALVALVALATGLGLLHRHLRGRARRTGGGSSSSSSSSGGSSSSEIVAIDGVILGARATLLQFSSEVCASCASTRRVLASVAAGHPGTSHIDIDVTHRPDLAARFRLLQTPTTLVLDARGALRARIGGAVRRDVLVAELDRVLEPVTP